MMRYHYDITGEHPFRDVEGIEHSNDRAAWRDAVRLIRDVEDHLEPGGTWVLTVRTGERIVYVIQVTASSGGGT